MNKALCAIFGRAVLRFERDLGQAPNSELENLFVPLVQLFEEFELSFSFVHFLFIHLT